MKKLIYSVGVQMDPRKGEKMKKISKIKEKIEERMIQMIKNKPALMFTLSYAVSTHFVYAAADPLAPIKKLSTFVTSLVTIYGGVQCALGIAEVGKSMGQHDTTSLTNGLWKAGGGAIMFLAGAVLTYLGLK